MKKIKITRRHLRRIIESTIYEQQYANKAEKEDAEREQKFKDDELAGQILSRVSEYTYEKGTWGNPTTDDDLLNLEAALEPMFDIDDTVTLNRVGYVFMQIDRLNVADIPILSKREMGGGGFKGLGDYIIKKMGPHSRLKSYPHIYALYQANV